MISLVRLGNTLQKTRYRLQLKIESPLDIVCKVGIYIRALILSQDPWKTYGLYQEKKLIERHTLTTPFPHLDFRGAKLPMVTAGTAYGSALLWAYYDSLLFYENNNDKFDSETVDAFEKYFESEGLYCYSNPYEEIDITVKAGETVIDAGAWIGPFSAYAAHVGAHVFAFEPSQENREFLKVTAQLNSNITIIPYALYDSRTKLSFSENNVGSKVVDVSTLASAENEIQVITLDEFVKDNNISRIDFIKSDIEGAERNLLRGATYVLKNHAPKLSICTYHHKEDPELLASIILAANPRYKIMQRKMKLFAWVPKGIQ